MKSKVASKREKFAKMVEGFSWDQTGLGPRSEWPANLKRVVSLVLDAGSPMAVAWGPDFRFVYNEPYAEIIQDKHPAALGASASDVFPEAWTTIAPLLEQAYAGEAVLIEDLELSLTRGGATKPAFFSFSYNPIKNAEGRVEGILAVVVETTGRVLREEQRAHVFDTVLSAISDFAYTFNR